MTKIQRDRVDRESVHRRLVRTPHFILSAHAWLPQVLPVMARGAQ
ncbi:hypothetical protein [Pseudomonas matsuisoli]|uniref:Uncharacterized protein n=1 Tax=Pseudomonas matsuisoli TaxID=1515666 RepID=A0A917V160_9PSED|nr:hypothetical protein [Pseudomonas matsuisoli]GGK08121.1 hypothetical protein GCM10009304_37810 [Pseudomonas matsuisoli]